MKHKCFIPVCILYALILLVCTLTFFGYIGHPKPEGLYRALPIDIHLSMSDTCTTLSMERLDSLSKMIDSFHKPHTENYENLLNDLRQESNNIINKWNGWFSFWIALLALLAGIIPLLAQMKVSAENRKLIEESIKELEEKKKALEEKNRHIVETLSYELRDAKETFLKDIKELKEHTVRVELANMVASLRICEENKLLLNDSHRNDLLKLLLKDVNEAFERFEKVVSNKSDSELYTHELLMALIHLNDAVCKLKMKFSKKHLGRMCDSLLTLIETTILKLLKNEFSNKIDLNNCIHEIQFKFKNLIEKL